MNNIQNDTMKGLIDKFEIGSVHDAMRDTGRKKVMMLGK